MAFDLEAYEPVALRLDRWLKLHPNGIVKTQLLSQPGADICVFCAELWVDGQCVSTGHAEEVRNSNMINKTSSMEVCETSAIGRALANAGMAGSDMTKRPSREEMGKSQRQAAGRGYLPAQSPIVKTSSTMAEANGISVKGNQFGPLPDWLVLEAAQAGVTQVWDNRDKVAGTRRPWFKDVDGDKAFWPPKGTPDPVVATHEDDLTEFVTDEEPF
jgi:type IV secretory pathway protease TraF